MSSASRLLFLLILGLVGPTLPCFSADSVKIPEFWDQRRRIERPDTSQIRQIRFLTEDDFPPFHFAGPDGALSGFEVDIALALCTELKIPCSIQATRWDGLNASLGQNRGDAIIAAMKITREARSQFSFTASYFRFPARFIGQKNLVMKGLAMKGLAMKEISAGELAGRQVAAVTGSTHEAFLKAFFPRAMVVPMQDARSVFDAVQSGRVALGFADGVTAAFWLNGEASRNCCAFVGGPYTESRYFGEGAGIAVRRDDAKLLQALDWALHRIAADGTYATLYLKYFPISAY